MGKIETTPQANLDHQQPPSSDDPDAAPSLPPVPHSHTTTSFPAHDDHQQPQHMEQEPPHPPTADPHTNDHHVPHVKPPSEGEHIDKTTAVAFPPQPNDSHAPPSSNQPMQVAPETASVRRQQPKLENGIDSIPAVAFPPQPRMQAVEPPRPNNQLVLYGVPMPEGNNMEGAGGGGASALVPVTPARQESGKAHLVLIQSVGNPWSSGLFDCYQHPVNAIITTVLPCVTFGQIAEIVDNGSTSCVTGAMLYFFLFLVICHWNVGVRYRRRVRNAYELAETPLTDRLAHVLFPLCALCQEFRELKNQGYDPFLGYNGVVAKIQEQMQQQSNNAIPPTSQMMMR
ncbi:proline-rich receptor-like protein kinase PERK10 [Vitis riparia]|uniref:proline-rich receptor-like protein kinase PERK10 n=1 Tax=Vitis riparia TaxID=96939 RepID=UPI00155A3DC8|nr:proline-rich receptor-like protein kinase PERK10 [Vitis riparia]